MQKVIILGGTQFIGRNLVERLLTMEGYDITLFNRGKSGAGLFPDAKRIIGNRRTKDIEQISRTKWDAVIDLSCYFPDDLVQVLNNLEHAPDKYVFVSTCSVYESGDKSVFRRNEDAPIVGCTTEEYSDETPATYGQRKAECERILQRSGIDHMIFRPALVYGANDPTDRLYYWLHQVKFKNALLMPDRGERKFSVTYVHDLVNAILAALQLKKSNGVYNAITVPEVSIGEIVQVAEELLQRTVPSLNASPEFLHTHGIAPWMDMPLWIDGDHFTYSNQRLKEDLAFVPSDLRKSIQETLAYYDSHGWEDPTYGMSEPKRLELLGLLKKSK